MLVSASDMLSLYVGLELQSLAAYVLAAFHRGEVRSSEAGLKYFVLGALASGVLLYGVSLVYGFTGTTSFQGIVPVNRSEEHTSELQSLMRTSYAVFCLKKKKITTKTINHHQ